MGEGNALGRRLVALRVRAGMSQEQLAAAAGGMSAKTISDLERGVTTNPRPATLRAIAAALGLTGDSWHQILDGTGEPPPEPEGALPATLAEAVAQLRARHRLSHKELADRTGLSTRSIADIEASRRRRIHLANAASLADAFALDEGAKLHFMVLASGATVPESLRFGAVEPANLSGRGQELAAVVALLGERRLVTLTGPGGVGKTTLAEAVLAKVGRPCVSLYLAEVPAGEDLARGIALMAGFDEEPDDGWVGQLGALLPAGAVLLLDNVEHLRGSAAAVDAILAGRADVSILVTSRTAVRMGSEFELEVAPLRMAAACRLFTATASRADGAAEATAEVIERICARLDRLPLAIMLAATWTRLMTPPEILARLDRTEELLRAPGRTRPDGRHGAVTSTVRWSLDLVSDRARGLFTALAAYPAAWPLDLIEAVRPRGDVLDALHELVEAKLVNVVAHEAGTLYGMLQTVRDVGHLDLVEDPALAGEIRERHAAHLLGRARELGARMVVAQQKQILAEGDRVAPHVEAALRHLSGRGDDRAVSLVAAWWRYWKARGRYRGGLALIEPVLSADRDDRDEAEAEYGAAALAYLAAHNERASGYAHGALARFRRLGDASGIGNLMSLIGMMALHSGDVTGALAWYHDGLSEVDGAADSRVHATLLGNIAPVYAALGDLPAARAAAEAAAARYQVLGDDVALSAQLGNQGLWAARSGERHRARELFTESIGLLEGQQDSVSLVDAYLDLVKLAIEDGDVPTAQADLETALRHARSSTDDAWTQAMAEALEAQLLVLRGEMAPGRSLARQALLKGEEIGFQPAILAAALADAAAAAWSNDARGALRAARTGLVQSDQADEAAVVSLALLVAAIRLDGAGPTGLDSDVLGLEREVSRWASSPGGAPYAIAVHAARRRGLTVTPVADPGPLAPVADLRRRALALCD